MAKKACVRVENTTGRKVMERMERTWSKLYDEAGQVHKAEAGHAPNNNNHALR